MTSTQLRRQALQASLLLAAVAAPLAAQGASRPGEREFRWSGTPQGDMLRVSNISGDVAVTAGEGRDVEVIARFRGGSADTDARVEVKQHAGGVTVCALYGEDSYCDDRGAHQEGRRGRRWDGDRGRYDIEVRIPRRMRVSAGSVSGDVQVTGTTAELSARSVSGDVTITDARAAGDLTATTVSGDVSARLSEVARGTELEMSSVSGDVSIAMPQATGFELRMSTVNGDLRSDFPLQMRGRFNRRSISAEINGGGSELEISTVSGDVRLAHN